MASDAPSSDAVTRQAINGEEEAEIEKAIEKESRKDAPMTAAGCWLRGLIIGAFLAIVFSCGGYYGIQAWIARFTAKRDALISDLRAQGEPLSAEDLAKFTALPEGTNDLTERYMGIVRNYIGKSPLSPEEELLPIVGGKGSMVVPGAGVPWTEEAVAQKYLANRPWLKDAEDLADVEGGVSIERDFSKGFAVLMDDIQAMRRLVRDLQLLFHVRMRTGDRAGALRSLRAMFRISGMLEREPSIISQLVRVATHGVSVYCAGDFLRDRQATPQEIAAIREMLDNDFRAALIRALRGERATGLITLTSHDFRQLNEVAGSQGHSNMMLSIPSSSKIADVRPGDTAKLLELLTEAIDLAEANDFPAMTKQFEILGDKFKRMEADEKLALPWNRHVLPNLLMPAIQQCEKSFARGASMEAALKATLDVEAKMQALPPLERTKEAEIAAILEVLPIDPFTGEPMKYVVDVQGYKIYSVGRNGIDDTATGGNMDLDNGVWIERTLDAPAKQ